MSFSPVPQIFLASILLLTGSATGQEGSDLDALDSLRSRLQQAESEGDMESLSALYAADIVFQTHETAPVVGSDAVLALSGRSVTPSVGRLPARQARKTLP